jgi:site-specific DNA recombinase
MASTNGHGSKAPERVVLYMRVSSEEQRDRETIEIQREFLEQYCRLYRLEIAKLYADDGVSGTVPLYERPEGRRLLEDAREDRFTAVLVSKLDRLGRSLLVIVDAHDRLDAAGATMRSGREPIDTSNPSGRLIFQMLASFAEYDRENIRERTQAGLHRAFRRGKHMGRIPYGYRANADAQLEVVEQEAEIVREIIGNIAGGSTLYAEAKRLNDSGVPAPGTRYGSGERKPGRLWQSKTLSNIVHQRAYIGVHCVKINGGEEVIEREVPIILENTSIRDKAVAALSENRRYRNRKNDRRYLLAGLVKCAHCGYGCSGHATWSKGKRYSYYLCIAKWPEKTPKAPPHKPPYVKAEWLEKTVWDDVRFFLENPGKVLERLREQMGDEDEAKKLERRQGDLGKRLAGKRAEKDRYVRLYAQGHISEDELSVYLADLKNQIGNLRLLLESVEADLSQHAEKREIAETTSTWLATLRERISEIEAETDEAFQARRQLVKLLVAGITVGRREDGSPKIEITYRFGPPSEAAGERDKAEMFVGSTQIALS